MKTKKLFLPLLGLLCLSGMAVAAPAGGNEAVENTTSVSPVKYQAVLRDERGYVRADETLTLTMQLLHDGNTVYEERHAVKSDALGQVEIFLGQGLPSHGSYAAIEWNLPLEMKVLEGNTVLASIPVTAVPTALHASKAATATTAETADRALSADNAYLADRAAIAQELAGKVFDDNLDPAPDTYYSSNKVQQLIEGQTGQTALAKEVAERKAEDLRLLDSIMTETWRRMAEDKRIWDSLESLRAGITADLSVFLDSLTLERKRRLLADEQLNEDIEALTALLRQETDNRTQEDMRLWDSIGKVAASEQNVCEASDHKRGIYTAPIPVYAVDAPSEKGLFTMPEMKILRQSASCNLFTDLHTVEALKQSYKTRVMVHNATGNSNTPTSVMIPAGNDLVDVYVDNFRISSPAEYFTYDVLVFEVEYYLPATAGGKGKMYVTLVRE